MNQSHNEKKTPALVSITRVNIDFVNQTMTLLDFDGPVAIYRPERTGFDINIVAHDPLKEAPDVAVRDLSYYDNVFKNMNAKTK